jgi:hypothetical protein
MNRAAGVASLVLVSLLLALAGAEYLARTYGFSPRVRTGRPEPAMHVPDPVLGWRPIPGRYEREPYVPGGSPIHVTFRADGARESGGDHRAGKPEVVLVGCSFTMGAAVSDEETWGWRLQELRPDLEVVNRGLGGYGTFQSLLLLEQLLGRTGRSRPRHVLYGFIDHSGRNVASPLWLWGLSFNTRAAATPYCTLDAKGRLERHPPEAYLSLPLHEHLALVALLERLWVERRARGREANAVRVTQLLIEELAERCRAAGVGFSMVLLTVPDVVKATYTTFAEQRHIDVIDCNLHLTAADTVPGDAHPNAAVHRRWGDCVAAALDRPNGIPPGADPIPAAAPAPTEAGRP